MADDTSTSSRADGSQTGAAEKPAAAFDLANNQPSDISMSFFEDGPTTACQYYNEIQQDQPSSNKNKQQKGLQMEDAQKPKEEEGTLVPL
eukprot:g4623.t1 g4623   contig15:1416718-1416987(+)